MKTVWMGACLFIAGVWANAAAAPARDGGNGAEIFSRPTLLRLVIQVAPRDAEALRREPREAVAATIQAG